MSKGEIYGTEDRNRRFDDTGGEKEEKERGKEEMTLDVKRNGREREEGRRLKVP